MSCYFSTALVLNVQFVDMRGRFPMSLQTKIVSFILGLTLVAFTVFHAPSLSMKQLVSTVASAVWGS